MQIKKRKISIFKENHVFIEAEHNPSDKVEEELDGIDIDDTGNLGDLPRLIFIIEGCGNLK